MRITAASKDLAGDLEEITGEVHDMWIDLDAVKCDDKARQVVIPVVPTVWKRWLWGLLQSGRAGKEPSLLLTIKGVKEAQIEDRERIGLYPINRLRFEERKRELVVRCDMPLGFRVLLDEDFVVETMKVEGA